MKTKAYILSFLSLILLCGCSTLKPNKPNNDTPLVTSETAEDLLAAIQNFSYNSSTEVLQDEKNHCYSPLSAYLTLSLLVSDANETTQKQILQALAYDGDNVQLSTGIKDLLEADSLKNHIELSNALWVNPDVKVSDQLKANAEEVFKASIQQGDFSNKDTVEVINQWIKEKTHSVRDANFKLDSDTQIAIVNALYMKDTWKEEFMQHQIHEDTFYTLQDKKINTTFLSTSLFDHPYFDHKQYLATMLELSSGAKLYFFQPKEGYSIKDVLSQDWMSDLRSKDPLSARVDLSFPRFAYQSDITLKDVLQKLGMKDAFDSQRANFSSTSKNDPLYLSSVLQSTYINVNEFGIEASGTTIADMKAGAALVEYIQITLDHPFFYVLTSRDQIPLFTGTLYDPGSSQ